MIPASEKKNLKTNDSFIWSKTNSEFLNKTSSVKQDFTNIETIMLQRIKHHFTDTRESGNTNMMMFEDSKWWIQRI